MQRVRVAEFWQAFGSGVTPIVANFAVQSPLELGADRWRKFQSATMNPCVEIAGAAIPLSGSESNYLCTNDRAFSALDGV